MALKTMPGPWRVATNEELDALPKGPTSHYSAPVLDEFGGWVSSGVGPTPEIARARAKQIVLDRARADAVAAFSAGLKAHLRATLSDSLPVALHGTGIFSPARIKRGAWDALEAAIDAFEFQAGER